MKRRDFLKLNGAILAGLSLPQLGAGMFSNDFPLIRTDFGHDFEWGVATAAYQIEGGYKEDGKGLSIWDTFSHTKKIKDGSNGDIACDFYHRYREDIALMYKMHIPNFRFSLSWSRIFPEGTGSPNQKGVDFYKRVIEACHEKGIAPWVTLYHWDLPQKLQDKGGWTNRNIINWFADYVDFCTRTFGDSVKKWMILNEPLAYTALGYMLGLHAPGKRGGKKFLKAAHHTTVCQGMGGKIAKGNVKNGEIGTTFSTTHVIPKNQKRKNIKAAGRIDAFLNRLYIEPMMGMGYPTDAWPWLKNIEKYIHSGDEELMTWDADFIGLQYYKREIAKKLFILPFLKAFIVPDKKREGDPLLTEMGWEVHPESFLKVLQRFGKYPKIKKIYVTENGAAFPDKVVNNRVHDTLRTEYIQNHLMQVYKAKQEKLPIKGYFIWTFMDNFEWREGYHPRFGIVHVDFKNQTRTLKDSGRWFQNFLEN